MTLIPDFTPEDEARLAAAARERGMDPAEFARELLREHLPPQAPGEGTRALFALWDAEDATDDPEEVAARNREWEEFEANINQARAAAGARLIYP
jgi:hypothetical protein